MTSMVGSGSGTYNINPWLGVVGEGSGRYQSQDVTALGRSFEPDRVRYWLLVGHATRFGRTKDWHSLGITLFGAVRARSEGITVVAGIPR